MSLSLINPRKTNKKLERGQSLVEMTVGFVILIMILMGLLDLGRAYYIYIALEDSAGEAAVYLSLYPACRDSTDGTGCADPNNALYRAQNAASGYFDWTDGNTTFTVDRPTPYGTGSTVEVTIQHTFELITPLIPSIAGADHLTLSATATQTIVSE